MIKFSLDNTHAYCFPTKVLAGNGGAHILNIELTAEADNGSIVSVGDYKSFDNYVEGVAPADYEAKIEELIAAYSKEYAAGTDLGTKSTEELTVSCYWAYSTSEANDLKDTELADPTTVPSVSLTITCTVTQID